MKNKQIVLPEFRELEFKPIDSAYYDSKISAIKIQVNDVEWQPIQPINYEVNTENFLTFKQNNNKVPSMHIDYNDADFSRVSNYNLTDDLINQSICNIYSENFHKREKYLYRRKNWTSIDLEDYEQKIKL